MQRTLITSRARSLRKTMSEPEVMLWSRLRRRTPDRPTFRRQHPLGTIIVDFFCASAQLAVEVDGATHWGDAALAKDEARDRWLERQGIEVMRIPASRVFHDLGGVTDAIIVRAAARRMELALRAGPSPSTPGSSLRSAGGPPPAASRGR